MGSETIQMNHSAHEIVQLVTEALFFLPFHRETESADDEEKGLVPLIFIFFFNLFACLIYTWKKSCCSEKGGYSLEHISFSRC